MESEGRRLHAQAASARENDQLKESLSFNDEALFAYDREDNPLGFAEGIACRSITLRNYATQQESRNILTLAKYEMMASVTIARESGDNTALPLPLYNLAQLQEALGEHEDAIETYSEAVNTMKNNPPESHNRPSVLADMKVHMTVCEYKAGDTSALERAEEALQQLEESEEPNKFNKDVWVSGGHMKLAEILIEESPSEAKEHLAKAKEIIDSNEELVLRKQQWERLSKSFN